MSIIRIALLSTAAVVAFGLANVASAADYDHTFLPQADYSKLVATPLPNNVGTDLVYIYPGVVREARQVHGIDDRSA